MKLGAKYSKLLLNFSKRIIEKQEYDSVEHVLELNREYWHHYIL